MLWVAPLTVVAAVAVCFVIKTIALALDPSLQRMGQLGPAMPTLAVEGAIAAVIVFILFALFLSRPIFWFRIVAVVALVFSLAPDVALAIGGVPMRLALRYVSTLLSVGESFQGGGGRPAGPPPGVQNGGSPPGFASGTPLEQVAVLMLLHAAVAIVCVVLLTTLPRVTRRRPSE